MEALENKQNEKLVKYRIRKFPWDNNWPAYNFSSAYNSLLLYNRSVSP